MCRMSVRLRIYCENTQFTFARPTRIRSGPRPWFPLVHCQLEQLHHSHQVYQSGLHHRQEDLRVELWSQMMSHRLAQHKCLHNFTTMNPKLTQN